MRNQPDMAVILAERLDRGLVIQQCGDDIAILRAVLLADHHEITIANGGVDHGITVHFKHEQIAGAGKPFGKPHHIIDMLLGRDRHAGGDAPDQWNVMRGHDGAACVVLTGERDDLATFPFGSSSLRFTTSMALLVRVHADEAFFVKNLKLVFDG